jgi:hypothetical protein
MTRMTRTPVTRPAKRVRTPTPAKMAASPADGRVAGAGGADGISVAAAATARPSRPRAWKPMRKAWHLTSGIILKPARKGAALYP